MTSTEQDLQTPKEVQNLRPKQTPHGWKGRFNQGVISPELEDMTRQQHALEALKRREQQDPKSASNPNVKPAPRPRNRPNQPKPHPPKPNRKDDDKPNKPNPRDKDFPKGGNK